jgi:hypothetical protein
LFLLFISLIIITISSELFGQDTARSNTAVKPNFKDNNFHPTHAINYPEQVRFDDGFAGKELLV